MKKVRKAIQHVIRFTKEKDLPLICTPAHCSDPDEWMQYVRRIPLVYTSIFLDITVDISTQRVKVVSTHLPSKQTHIITTRGKQKSTAVQ